MKTDLKWEDAQTFTSYHITIGVNLIPPQLSIIITKNQYSSLCYESKYSLASLIAIHSSFSSFISLEDIHAFLIKQVSNQQVSISQGRKALFFSFKTEKEEDVALQLLLNTESIDKDALIEELTLTVPYLNNKIEALICKLAFLESNTVSLNQFNEMIRRIERVSSGLPSYNSLFVNPNIDIQMVNRYKAMTLNDILVNYDEERQMIHHWIAPDRRLRMTLIYKASSDSFTANAFHSKCDYYPKTLVLIKTDQGIRFGGYTEVTWNNTADFKADAAAFLFSIEKKEKYPIQEGSPCAVYCRYDHGPTFGEGFDLCLVDNFNSTDGNYSNFPTSYGKGFEKHALTSNHFNFKVAEVEVYQIESDDYN